MSLPSRAHRLLSTNLQEYFEDICAGTLGNELERIILLI